MAPRFSEHAFLEWMRGLAVRDPRLVVGLGDDGAVTAPDLRHEVLVVDTAMEGVHAAPGPDLPEVLTRKAVRSNVSDVAAMGARPTLALLALVLPARSDESVARRVHAEATRECERFGIALCGGDTVCGGDRLVVSITLTGTLFGSPVTRSGASPGDLIVVTGRLGGSLLGRHAEFTPRLDESEALVRLGPPSAMTDVSDGLLRDLANLASASGIGAVVRADAVPIHDDARTMAARDSRSALDHALGDGEDFELLFTASPEVWSRIESGWKIGTSLSVIGEMAAEGLWLEDAAGRRPVEPGGFDHGTSSPGESP